MKEYLWSLRERLRGTRVNPLIVWLNTYSLGLRDLVVEGWLALDARFRREAHYSYDGISLRFKITSSVELKRVRNKGQPFTLNQLVSRLTQGSVFYDLGANIGIFTLPAARLVGEEGHVVAFEPCAANYHRLLQNTERNGLDNVTVFGLALGSANKTALLYRPTNRMGEGGNSLLRPSNLKFRASRIPLACLDDLINLWELPLPQFVKIDVEGSEVEVLKGMKKTLASETLRTIVCETSATGTGRRPDLGTEVAVGDLLAPYGFVETARSPTGDGGLHYDILFVKTGGNSHC